MDNINIRYGESVTLPLDTGSALNVSAAIFIGKPGTLYAITQEITLTDGVGVFELTPTDTRIPLGTYQYQVNVTDADGRVEKYPSFDDNGDCGDCDSDFPTFTVKEALDETEVS